MVGKKGFTLVEILIIIALLGALVIESFLGLKQQFVKIRDAQRKLDIKRLQSALNEYYDSTLCYPPYLPKCGEPLQLGSVTFIDATPCDPLTKTAYPYDTDTKDCNGAFRLYTTLEQAEDPDIRYVGCLNGCGPEMCIYNYGVASPNSDLTRCQPPEPTPAPNTPTPLPPSATPTPLPLTPTPIPADHIGQFVCAPGIGNGRCLDFTFPDLSDCPRIYLNDPTCNNECTVKENLCKNSSGKTKQN